MEQTIITKGAPRKRGLNDQFGSPSGLPGSLVGLAMAIEHRELHRAAVERLRLTSTDRVLEVGFGPGTALRLAAAQASFVAGIDPSREMARQAVRRNRTAVLARRAEIQCASASMIPYPNDSFTVVFEVNSFHHWDHPAVGLKEIFRVLRPGGRLLMSLNGAHGHSVAMEARRLSKMLEKTGFTSVEVEENRIGHGGAFVTARR